MYYYHVRMPSIIKNVFFSNFLSLLSFFFHNYICVNKHKLTRVCNWQTVRNGRWTGNSSWPSIWS
jgi:hypothetical protein